jgi:hypothetical protein
MPEGKKRRHDRARQGLLSSIRDCLDKQDQGCLREQNERKA